MRSVGLMKIFSTHRVASIYWRCFVECVFWQGRFKSQFFWNVMASRGSIKVFYEHKIRERKVRTLTKNRRDHGGQATNTHTETKSKYFDGHCRLSQSEESECMWAHDKYGVTRLSERCHQGLREEWMEGNLKRDYLRLMSGLCLEDRIQLVCKF